MVSYREKSVALCLLCLGYSHSRSLPQDQSRPDIRPGPYRALPTTTWRLGARQTVTWNTSFGPFVSSSSVDAYLCHSTASTTTRAACVILCASVPTSSGRCESEIPRDFNIQNDVRYFVVVTPRTKTPQEGLSTGVPGAGPTIRLLPSQNNKSLAERGGTSVRATGKPGDESRKEDSEGGQRKASEEGTRVLASTCISATLFGGVSAGIIIVMGLLWLISILYLQRQLRLWVAAAIAASAAAAGRSGAAGSAAAAAALFGNKTPPSGGPHSHGSREKTGSSGPSAGTLPHIRHPHLTGITPRSDVRILRSSMSFQSSQTGTSSSSSIIVTEDDSDELDDARRCRQHGPGRDECYRRSRDSSIFV